MDHVYRWVCPVCNERFRTRNELRSHKKSLNHYMPRKTSKGKTYNELFGLQKALEIKKKLSDSMRNTYSSYYSNSNMNKERIEKIKNTAAKYHRIGRY